MIGLIARADNRGLGQQTWAFHRNMEPARTMVVDCPSAQPLELHMERFPGAYIVRGLPTRDDFHRFLDGLTGLYTAETGYGDLWSAADHAGVRTVLHANYEFWDTTDRPTVLAVPSLWNINHFPGNTVHLPVPIEADRLTVESHPPTAQHFLHVVGRPAIHDRNGTLDVLLALQHVTQPIAVTITCQQHGYVGALINDHNIHIPGNITLNVESGDIVNYWDIYHHVDAMLLPRRFGGLCLPANEAVGSGIPVIMPNIDPNNTWLPEQWLTPAHMSGEFWAKQHIQFYRTPPEALAQKIIQLATDEQFYTQAVTQALTLRNAMSWEALEPRYREVL
jgi:hypothetical protein